MSAAHEVPVRPALDDVLAVLGAETVVEVVAPRWRWRIITPDQWRVLSRLGRRARVRDLVGSADGAAAAEVLERVAELVRAGLCVLEEVPEPAVEDVQESRPEPVDPPREVDAAWPWSPGPAPAADPEPVADPEPPGADPEAVADPEPVVGPEPAVHDEPAVDDLGALPRRDPGRSLSPVAATLQRRHAQIRRTEADDVFRAPDTDVLRRLLGSLRNLDAPASPEPGGNR